MRWFAKVDSVVECSVFVCSMYLCLKPVSYTHLDVYKRQSLYSIRGEEDEDY